MHRISLRVLNCFRTLWMPIQLKAFGKVMLQYPIYLWFLISKSLDGGGGLFQYCVKPPIGFKQLHGFT
ncbi:hypothetical protein GDO81_007219 [Engystomops pustulosus]|uniref:Uncharacterized protein n=1 Tax=Engystomops pustulosus TaxID=76066 RepID=A0AAV7C6M2_ENGPU|nr:hypothetical protein GDO81_007219 [Engystomops pustulosus]